MTHPAPFQQIVDGFSRLHDWEDRYRYILTLGRTLPKLKKGEKSEVHKIHGCVSQVWLVPDIEVSEGQINIIFRAESDAMIVQGLVAVLLAIYSGRPAAEVAQTDAIELLDQLGLRDHLSAQRSNGLMAMVTAIRAEGRRRSTHI